MREIRQSWIAGFLALCLVAAGFVGTSPTLHRLVEHAGLGAAHTHRHGAITWHDHGDGHSHSHRPGDWAELTDPASDWSAPESLPEPQTAPTPAEHDHHGLVQMLIDGLLDCPLEWEPFAAPFGTISARALPATEFESAFLWFAPVAGRAPPFRS